LALDRGVHLRLREHWLVDLVVSVLAVADDVHHHVALEGLAPLGRQPADARHSLHVVAVHVKDGRLMSNTKGGSVGEKTRATASTSSPFT